MRLVEMLLNRYLLLLGVVFFGGYVFWTAGLVGQAIMVCVVLAVVVAWKRARGEEAGACSGYWAGPETRLRRSGRLWRPLAGGA